MESLTTAVIGCIERGWVPNWLSRALTRRLCAKRLGQLEREAVSASTFADEMRCAPVAPVPEKANEQHYELPAEFFDIMLGPRLKYSCCYFENPHATLEEAEVAAMRQSCERAQLSDGMNILELGCGWGSLTLWMLENYPAATVTAVSNSRLQCQRVIDRAEELGVADRLTLITADMNAFDIDDRFDRVVSCEMFEHMRNYEQLLKRIAGWLKPDGKLFVHIFCHKTFGYRFETRGASNWMGRYFFTGGIMPNARIFDQFTEHLKVANAWVWDGTHYEKTCNAWLLLLDQRRGAAMKILEQAYGDRDAARWFQRWRLFLIAGAALFGFQNGTQWQVGHYLLEPASSARQNEPSQRELLHS